MLFLPQTLQPNNSYVGGFYLTIWEYYNARDTLIGELQNLLGMPWTYVTYCHFDMSPSVSSDDEQPKQKQEKVKKDPKYKNAKAKCAIVADHIAMANGINMSPDGSLLYVSGLLDQAIHVYHVVEHPLSASNLSTHLLKIDSVATGTLCDNIDVERNTGDIYCGAHPNALAFLAHQTHPLLHPAPSQVLPSPPLPHNKHKKEN